MRFPLAALAVCGVLVVPDETNAQTSLDAFGALPLVQLASVSDSGVPLDFGGRVSIDLGAGFQAVGEFGRIGNVLPAIYAVPLSLVPGGVHVSAFYGEGGLRLLAAPRSAVTPYGEGTLGMAHLQPGVRGLSPTANALARAALSFVDSRELMMGAGGGVLFRLGALNVDLGYRYKRILADSLVGSLLSVGQNLDTHQMRFGIGVRF